MIIPHLLRQRSLAGPVMIVSAIWLVNVVGVLFPSRSATARAATRELNRTLSLLLDRGRTRELSAKRT
jgi:hypothetical protein